jgi:hypothetical protein
MAATVKIELAAAGVGVTALGIAGRAYLVSLAAPTTLAWASGPTTSVTAYAAKNMERRQVALEMVENTLNAGAKYWDTAHNNIAHFTSSAGGTLQVASRSWTQDGASWIVENVVRRPESLDQIPQMMFKGEDPGSFQSHGRRRSVHA